MDSSYYQSIRQRCAFASLRKATRVATQFFDDAYRSSGLRSTQCSLLLNVSLAGSISISELGGLLRMDQTTVTRNIKLLEDRGYISSMREDGDARRKTVSITQLGAQKLDAALPNWERAQARIEQELGAERFQEFLRTLRLIEDIMK